MSICGIQTVCRDINLESLESESFATSLRVPRVYIIRGEREKCTMVDEEEGNLYTGHHCSTIAKVDPEVCGSWKSEHFSLDPLSMFGHSFSRD